MGTRRIALSFAAIVVAAFLAGLGAWWAAVTIEARSAAVVRSKLLSDGITWAEVEADGLQVRLTGTAPNEAARFRAVNLVGTVVQSARVRDDLDVAAVGGLQAPRFSVEMLRNDDGISLIGLVPGAEAETALTRDVTGLADGASVSNMLETADYPVPEGWAQALDFGLAALTILPRSKISVAADEVAVTAISGSPDEKRRLETELARQVPAGLRVSIDISAPRPVLTPFTLRFVKDAGGARFDACSADTDRARDRIVAAALKAGAVGKLPCTVGLGVPTPRWAEAAETAIAAVATMGSGTITFSDADVTLLAGPDVTQAVFDRVTGDLQAQLPAVFSLTATLPPKDVASPAGPVEFTATLDARGQVQLRGRLADEAMRTTVDSFAKAKFGADRVYTATRFDPNLPGGWPVRVLAGLQALGEVHDGTLLVRPDVVEVTGTTGSTGARARIAQVLSRDLGQGQRFRVNVTYDEALDPTAALPTPEECIADLGKIMSVRKITFTPGSAEVDGDTGTTIEALGAVLLGCPPLDLEIAGYTDSQGSDGGNRALSQARAEAVLTALQGRRLPVDAFVAKGYGEDDPVADNATEAGREANRRIEFHLLGGNGPVADTAPPAPVPVAGGDGDAGAADETGTTTAVGVADPDLTDDTENVMEPAGDDASAATDDAGSGDAGSGDAGSGDEGSGDGAGDDPGDGAADGAADGAGDGGSGAVSDGAVAAPPPGGGDDAQGFAPSDATSPRPKTRP